MSMPVAPMEDWIVDHYAELTMGMIGVSLCGATLICFIFFQAMHRGLDATLLKPREGSGP